MSPDFDILTATATELRGLLTSGKTTSARIVERYLDQINQYDSELRALISVASRENVLRIAALLDEERARGHIRGPLHGIPIVPKDAFITASDLGMPTTAGSWATFDAKASKNAEIVQRLVDAGMIILAKANMTEFAGMRTVTAMVKPGWSAPGGQTLSPYVGPLEEDETLLGHSAAGGSSTGSAVAVAAGFSPLSLGTETIGSIITPAARAALYAIKPNHGSQNPNGMFTLTDFFDSPGPMAKSAADLLLLMQVLMRETYPDIKSSWDGLSVGFLDPDVWKTGEAMCRQHEGTAEQMKQDYLDMVAMISKEGCKVKYPMTMPDVAQVAVDGKDAIMPIAFWDFKNLCIPRFLAGFDESPVRNLADIIRFHEENKEKCLPPPYNSQADLIQALEDSNTVDYVLSLKTRLRREAKERLDRVFANEGVNLIAAPSDSPLCIHAAAAGYPVATVPLGQLRYNGRPFGLCLLAKEHEEASILQFMAAYEKAVPPRPVPDLNAVRNKILEKTRS
ncbi:Glutamyl-tRNA amidotransferase subunit A, mitochondrial [Echria macrotheca]|uniref:Glutamyl-tRNA amidotransferase subunit A, mitochondrial n=1 Tax=Echria macrotheca TaxID=438768 RepID=A0AAJ0BBA4_9PEZI|nr:Glutamyl-tRNA amidotransferase subunit A, mitochondrial [Echria macrotheca]